MRQIENAFPSFSDLSGRLIDGGLLYIGEPNEDPEYRPVQVFWDAAGTIPAEQPLKTIAGLVAREGAPARVYTPSVYSSRLRERNGREVYFDPIATGIIGGDSLLDEGIWSPDDSFIDNEGIWSA